MQKVITLRNLNKLIALSMMLLIIVTPITFAQLDRYGSYNEPYRQSSDPYYNYNQYNQQNYASGTYGNSDNLGEAIVVNVDGYEPAVIKSNQIESTDLPIYVFLRGQTLGSLMGENAPETEPFISNPNIRNIIVYPSDYTTQFIRGAPIYVKPNPNSIDLDNLGYLVVMLRQIKDEEKVPEEIILNMSMKIYFDFMRGFGDVSAVDLSLKEYGDESKWRESASENSFWNKKGFLRLVSVENNRARIQVYNSQISPLSLFSSSDQSLLENYQNQAYLTMSPGEIRTITLPGSSAFFHDQVRIKLNDISDPQTEARLRVVSGTGVNYYTLTKGMKISPGSNWYIQSIYEKDNIKESTAGTVIIRNAFGDKRVLEAKNSLEKVPEITDQNINDFKNTICPESIDVNENTETDQINKELENQDDDEKKINAASKLICTGIKEYERAITDDINLNDQSYLQIGDAYLTLSSYYINDLTKYLYSRTIALYYYKKVSNPAILEQKLSNLEDEIYNNNLPSNTVYIDEEGLVVALTSIIKPDEKSSADISVNGASANTYSIGDNNILSNWKETVNGKEVLYTWRVISIGSDSVTIQKFMNNQGQESVYLSLGESQSVDKTADASDSFLVKDIKSSKRAYVTVMPGGGDTYSESSFIVHIPIEKRQIQWTPEQIDKMIKDTNKQIEILDGYITKLNSIVKTWTQICFVTFTLLTVKNAFAPDRNRARKDVMPYYDKKCSDEVAKGTYATYDKCMSNQKTMDDVEKTLNIAETKQKAIKDCSTKGKDCYSKFDLYPNQLKNPNPDLKDKLDELKITDPIDSATWDEYNKACIEYNDLTIAPETFIKANEQKCKEVTLTITNQKKAFDSAININIDEINALKEEDSTEAKAEVVNNFRIDYIAAKAYNEGALANKDEILNKIKTASKLDIKDIVVQAYSNSKLGDKYTFIKQDAKGEIIQESGYTLYPEKNNQGIVDSAVKIDRKQYKIFVGPDGNNYAALDTIDISQEGLRTTYAAGATAEFDNKGRPYCIPTKEGNYIRISEFYATGDPSVFDEWNVGTDGLLCTQDDLQITDYKRMERREGEVVNLVRNKNCKEGGVFVGTDRKQYPCSQQGYKKAQAAQQGHCQDVMDPDDCKTLFAVCDPVLCPPSRFNLGGEWNLGPDESVVQTGIIGSLVLGSANYPEVPLPVCLPGILAGLKSIRSLLNDFVGCLYAAKINHENIGICDKIRSIGVCELLWREAINIFKLKGGISNIISDALFDKDKGSGGEILNGFNENINAVSDSVNFFTKEYGSSFFAAYNGRSTAEIGTEVCKSAIYGKFADVGNFVDQLTEPEDPPQFFAQFDESPWSIQAGRTFSTTYGPQTSKQSMYSVYYHIYAGNIPDFAKTSYAATGIKYAVYLKDDLGNSIPVTTINPNQIWDTIPYKRSKDISVERLGPLGMTTICALIDGREYCGFGKVTTNFGLNKLNDKLVADEALRKNINTADKCISDVPTTSPSLGSVVLPREYGILSTGIVRTCSVLDPDKGSSSDYWQQVGTCGTDKEGKNLGTCWIDTRTIDVNNAQLNEDISKNIILNQKAQEVSTEKLNELKTQLFDAQQSQYFLKQLDTKKETLNKEVQKNTEKLINLLNSNDIKESITDDQGNTQQVIYNYRQISKTSIDSKSRIQAQIGVGEIYISVAKAIPTPEPKCNNNKICESGREETKDNCADCLVDVVQEIGGTSSGTGAEIPTKAGKTAEQGICVLKEGKTLTFGDEKKYGEIILTLKESKTFSIDKTGYFIKFVKVDEKNSEITIEQLDQCGTQSLRYSDTESVLSTTCIIRDKKIIVTADSYNKNTKKATFSISYKTQIKVDKKCYSNENCPENYECQLPLVGKSRADILIAKCSSCGGEILDPNLCDKQECYDLSPGNCYYNLAESLLNRCHACPDNCKIGTSYCNQCSNCQIDTNNNQCVAKTSTSTDQTKIVDIQNLGSEKISMMNINNVYKSNLFKGDNQLGINKGTTFTIYDIITGKSFKARARGTDLIHTDAYPLTAEDTKVIKEIRNFNGEFTAWCSNSNSLWNGRAVLVHSDADPNPNNWIVAASRGCPHGRGMDGYNFKAGQTLRTKVVENNYPGHFCLHFYGSTTHSGKKNLFSNLIKTTFNNINNKNIKIKEEVTNQGDTDIDPEDIVTPIAKSSASKNFKVCIDPGHNDNENVGACGSEAKLNLQLGLELKSSLETAGYSVYMTRETDKRKIQLQYLKDGCDSSWRGYDIQQQKCDLAISLHSDAGASKESSLIICKDSKNRIDNSGCSNSILDPRNLKYPTGTGWDCVDNNNKLPCTYIPTVLSKSKTLANIMKAKLVSDSTTKKLGSFSIYGDTDYASTVTEGKSSSIGVLCRSNTPAVLIEMGSHGNADHCDILKNKQTEMANAITNAVNDYYKINLVS